MELPTHLQQLQLTVQELPPQALQHLIQLLLLVFHQHLLVLQVLVQVDQQLLTGVFQPVTVVLH
jgi:hypothetical protein